MTLLALKHGCALLGIDVRSRAKELPMPGCAGVFHGSNRQPYILGPLGDVAPVARSPDWYRARGAGVVTAQQLGFVVAVLRGAGFRARREPSRTEGAGTRDE